MFALLANFFGTSGLCGQRINHLNAVIALAVACGCKQMICKTYKDAYPLCESSPWLPLIVFQPLVGALYFITLVVQAYWTNFNWKAFPIKTAPFLLKFFGIALAFQAMSLASSSFVEEEHQTWYFLTISMMVLLFANDLKWTGSQRCSSAGDGSATNLVVRLTRLWQSRTLQWTLLLGAHVLMRRLNQTGDKWLMVPDVGDWLTMDANRMWNSGFVMFSVAAMVYQCTRYASVLANILTFTASVLVYYYRTQSGAVYFLGFRPSESKVSLIIFSLNIVEIVAITYGPALYKWRRGTDLRKDYQICLGCNVIVFALVSSLLHRPHNIFLNFGLLWTASHVNESIDRCVPIGRWRNVCRTMAHFFLGKTFFFYQGNSNSLASVDLNAGYVGSSGFNFYLVAVLLTINTYSSAILSLLILLYNSFDQSKNKSDSAISDVMMSLTVMVAVPFTVFMNVAVAFQNHIFVWTVFSPKLIYEYFHLCLTAAFIFVYYTIEKVF